MSSTVQVHYNDSPKEIMTISMRFLTELFPTSTIPAQQAVADFSDSCSESIQYNDVANNRNNFQILSGTYTNVSVTPNDDRTFADVSGTCIFKDIPKDPKNPNAARTKPSRGFAGSRRSTENWKWWLCSSHFEGIGVTTGSLRSAFQGVSAPNRPGRRDWRVRAGRIRRSGAAPRSHGGRQGVSAGWAPAIRGGAAVRRAGSCRPARSGSGCLEVVGHQPRARLGALARPNLFAGGTLSEPGRSALFSWPTARLARVHLRTGRAAALANSPDSRLRCLRRMRLASRR